MAEYIALQKRPHLKLNSVVCRWAFLLLFLQRERYNSASICMSFLPMRESSIDKDDHLLLVSS
jgi:hypothetical protein